MRMIEDRNSGRRQKYHPDRGGYYLVVIFLIKIYHKKSLKVL
jgi:hypothetical protein